MTPNQALNRIAQKSGSRLAYRSARKMKHE
jgi:hypothetical protein